MKPQVLLAAAFAALSMHGVSHADAPALSRAEVLADLQLWRESGLDELVRLEVPPMSTPEYRAAAARYEALRRAPAFAALVRRFQP